MAAANQNAATGSNNPNQQLVAAPLQQPPPSFPIGGLRIATIPYSQYVQRLDARVLDTRKYRYQRAVGPVAGDVTSFLVSQQDWGSDRDDRPSVLFQLYPSTTRSTMEPGLLLTPSPTTAFPELLVVVDDRDGQPLPDFSELPIVISTKVEGWLLEAWMRLNQRMTHEDVIQRMPHLDLEKWSGRDNGGGFKNTLSARRRDFRQIGRCLSWEENSARRSAFDRRLLEDVASDPMWQADQTTRYLKDMTLAERKVLIAENSRVRAGTKDGDKGPGSGSSPQVRKRPGEGHPEGRPGPKITKVDKLGFDLDDFDWPFISAEAERARQEAAAAGNTKDFTTILNPDVDAGTITQNAMPPDPQENVLLTGDTLVNELAVPGVMFMPQYQLPAASDDREDARYAVAQSSEDRRQLFLAVHPTLSSIVKQHPFRRFTLDLTSYAAVFNQLQDQYVHASFLENRNADLSQAQQMQQPLPAWAGAISEFDSIWVPIEELENVEGREWNKLHNVSYVFHAAFEEKAEALGLLAGNERALVVWPEKLVITADFCLESRDWIVRLTDFEE